MSARTIRSTDLTAVEWLKLFRRPSLWILLALEAVLLVVMAIAVGVTPMEAGETRPSVLELAVPIGLLSGQVFAAVAGAALAQEYVWRTLPLTLSRGAPRVRMLLVRFLAQLPGLVLVAAVPLAAGVLLSLGGLGTALAASHLELGSLWLVALAVAAGMLPYLSLGYLLAVASRAVAITVGGVLLSALLIEQLLSQFVPRIAAYLPSALASALLGGSGVGRAWAGVGIAAYAALFLVTAAVVLRRQDLTG